MQASTPKSRAFFAAFSGVEQFLEYEIDLDLTLLTLVPTRSDGYLCFWVSLEFASMPILLSILSETPLSVLKN